MTFKVGDIIVYPSQGGGRIDEITTREVLGETQKYFKLSFIRGDLDVLIPVKKSNEVNLRHALKPAELDKVFKIILSPKMDLPAQWPPRHRFELEILARAESFELAGLVGTLLRRDLEKGLADTEREIMERAKDMLASELAVVQGITLKEATNQIKERIETIKN